jgi:hypothetical protein
MREDGGGIRGYWTLLVLEMLMELVAEEEEKNYGRRKGFCLAIILTLSVALAPEGMAHQRTLTAPKADTI